MCINAFLKYSQHGNDRITKSAPLMRLNAFVCMCIKI